MVARSVLEHSVRFYEADACLLDAMLGWIGEGLRSGGAGVVIATQAHREGLDQLLEADGINTLEACADGRYVALDAGETLSAFMVDGLPHPGRFAEVVGGVIDQAATGGRPVHVFGEMVVLLARDGNPEGALQLEHLWNDLQREKRSFRLLCGYPVDELGAELHNGLVEHVCAAHSSIVPAESYTRLVDDYERLREVSVLQQKARRLEAEVAERRRAEEQLEMALAAEQVARQGAEEAVRARDEFLAIASHELRNPVAAVNGTAQMLLRLQSRGTLGEEALSRHFDSLLQTSNRLNRLVEDLLDVGRLESGRLHLDLQPLDLSALVRDVVGEEVRGVSEEARRRVHLDGVEEELAVVLDRERVGQILSNLLENALKYSPDGEEVRVSTTAEGGSAVVRITDRGIGIPGEALETIFQPFGRAANATTRNVPGLGLGLYVARQIAQAHGGSLWAESAGDGQGSTFVLALPLLAGTAR